MAETGTTVNVIDEIKKLILNNVSQDQLNTSIEEASKKIETRHNDLKAEISAATDQSIVKAFAEFQKSIEAKMQTWGNKEPEYKHDTKVYGVKFHDFLKKCRIGNIELKALSENVGADGGYLVPEVWVNEMQKIALENSVVRPRARTIQMSSNNISMPFIKGNSNAAGSLYGGVTTYWADASEDLSALSSKPKLGKLSMVAHKMIGYCEAENELMEDAATNINGLVQQLFSEAIAFEEDDCFINGNGVAKPLGILQSSVRVTVSRQTASHISLQDIVTMYSRFTGNMANAVWMINQSVVPELFQLRDDNSNNIFLSSFNQGVTRAPLGSLLGIPVVVTEKCQALGTEGDILLGDFGYYLVGDRSGLRIEQSKDYKFNTDVLVWKFVKRLDGRLWLASAVTPRRGGSTLSPFVALT